MRGNFLNHRTGLRSYICRQGHNKRENKSTNRGCTTCRKEWRAAWWEKNLGKRIEYTWKFEGIKNKDGSQFTTVNFDYWYQIQKGCCAICARHSSEFQRRLHADHNHTTGIFRGLLCAGCNTKLSVVENELFSSKAQSYLRSR